MTNVTATVEKITPAMATAWLNLNTKNRDLKKANLETLKRDLRAGNWMLNGETIIFSDTNRLLNGQHRLEACEATNVAFESVVVRGIKEDAMKTIDTGSKRTSGDNLNLKGVKNPNVVSGAITRILYVRSGGTDKSVFTTTSHTTIENMFYQNKTRLEEAVAAVAGRSGLSFVRSSSSLAALMFFISYADRQKAAAFIEGLATGANLPKNSPMLTARNFFNNATARNRAFKKHEHIIFLIKAWNAFYNGKTLNALYFKKGEEFPMIAGNENLV